MYNKSKLVYLFSLFFFHSLTLLWFIKNLLVYSQLILEQISQTMVIQIPLKVHTDTYTYSLFLISIANHYTSWPSSFICGCNANGFVKGIQQEFFYWNSCRFGQGHNTKFYNPARIVTEMLSTYPLFTTGKAYTKFMLGTLFSEWCHSNNICREKWNSCIDFQINKLKNWYQKPMRRRMTIFELALYVLTTYFEIIKCRIILKLLSTMP
jgi:hypothetical protein